MVEPTQPTSESRAADRKSFYLIIWFSMIIPAYFIAVSEMQSGVSVYPWVDTWIVCPIALIGGLRVLMIVWKKWRAANFTYEAKDGSMVEMTLIGAVFRGVFLVAMMSVVIGFIAHGLMRFVVQIMPGQLAIYDVHITSYSGSRGCRRMMSYQDPVTSQTVMLCADFVPGNLYDGELLRVNEIVGHLGTRVSRFRLEP